MHDYVDFLLGFQRLLKRTNAVRLIMEPKFGISPPQFFLLLTIWHRGRCTASELAGELGVSAPAMTASTSRLIELGFIDRQVDSEDRRRAFLSLTDSGHKVVKELLATASGVIDQFFSGLEPDEANTFMALMTKMTAEEEE